MEIQFGIVTVLNWGILLLEKLPEDFVDAATDTVPGKRLAAVPTFIRLFVESHRAD